MITDLVFRDLCGSVIKGRLSEHTFQIEASDHALPVCICTFLTLFHYPAALPLQVREFLGRGYSLPAPEVQTNVRTPLLPCNIRASDSKPMYPHGAESVAARGSRCILMQLRHGPLLLQQEEILSKWLNDLLPNISIVKTLSAPGPALLCRNTDLPRQTVCLILIWKVTKAPFITGGTFTNFFSK